MYRVFPGSKVRSGRACNHLPLILVGGACRSSVYSIFITKDHVGYCGLVRGPHVDE